MRAAPEGKVVHKLDPIFRFVAALFDRSICEQHRHSVINVHTNSIELQDLFDRNDEQYVLALSFSNTIEHGI